MRLTEPNANDVGLRRWVLLLALPVAVFVAASWAGIGFVRQPDSALLSAASALRVEALEQLRDETLALVRAERAARAIDQLSNPALISDAIVAILREELRGRGTLAPGTAIEVPLPNSTNEDPARLRE